MIVPFLDPSGAPTDPITPDTQFSVDGGITFNPCTEEITTGGNKGFGFITLTGAETNNSGIALNFDAASGPNATLGVWYPRVLPIILSGTASAGGNTSITLAAGAYDLTGCIVRTTGGTGGGGTGGANNQARVITAYSSLVATVEPAWEVNPANGTTYEILLTDMACVAVKANVTTLDNNVITAASIAANAITDAKVASDVTIASVTGSVGSVTGSVGSVVGLTASNVGAIKTKTDSLTFTVSGKVDANALLIDGSTAAATAQKKAALTVITGTVDAGATTTSIPIKTLNMTVADMDQLVGLIIGFPVTAGTGRAGQKTTITAVSAAGPTLTVAELTRAPSEDDEFVIL